MRTPPTSAVILKHITTVCAEEPPHSNHAPPDDKPLRGFFTDKSSIDEAGTHLSKLNFSVIYGREPDESRSGDLVFRQAGYNISKGFSHTTDGASFQATFDWFRRLTQIPRSFK
ncbi:hypothetical protein V496_01734 [Pseudogymnoascus sp. VKM F-4515 (FW-2607)]|nr:hypothetical protein V496_01734 [Pseudogymnoascus sp. VKM F-4515 (FW-2607)]